MRSVTDTILLLCFALTSLYVGSRLFPETMQAKRTEVEQWWHQQKEHIDPENQKQKREPDSRTAQN